MSEIIINRRWYSSFTAGGMRIELTGTCTVGDLQDAEKVIELALRQIRRDYLAQPQETVTAG